MGGNPTSQPDPQEISEYPVGTMPESDFQLPAYDFGKSVSPNGLCEYIGGALDGKILVTRYSGGKDIIVLTPGKDGNITKRSPASTASCTLAIRWTSLKTFAAATFMLPSFPANN